MQEILILKLRNPLQAPKRIQILFHLCPSVPSVVKKFATQAPIREHLRQFAGVRDLQVEVKDTSDDEVYGVLDIHSCGGLIYAYV